MTAEVVTEILYSTYCAACGWGEGRISTTEAEAELMAETHNRSEHTS